MSTRIWIKIGLWLVSKWLSRQNDIENNCDKHPLIQNLIGANSTFDFLNIVTDETTEEAVLEILSDAKNVNIGEVINKVVVDLVKK